MRVYAGWSTVVRDRISRLRTVCLVLVAQTLPVRCAKDVTETVPVFGVKTPVWHHALPFFCVPLKFLYAFVPSSVHLLTVSFASYGIQDFPTSVRIFPFPVCKPFLLKMKQGVSSNIALYGVNRYVTFYILKQGEFHMVFNHFTLRVVVSVKLVKKKFGVKWKESNVCALYKKPSN